MPWAEFWYLWTVSAFLGAYLSRANAAPFLPPGEDDLKALLRLHLMEKAVYELAYELNNRPDWVPIALMGLRELLETA